MENISAYKLIVENSKEKLEEKMKEVIDNKYFQPIGGISVTCKEGVLIFVQAIVAIG